MFKPPGRQGRQEKAVLNIEEKDLAFLASWRFKVINQNFLR
jgi:hypothetical protein